MGKMTVQELIRILQDPKYANAVVDIRRVIFIEHPVPTATNGDYYPPVIRFE